ncbi:MAG: eukaryotic-like serine/threonine-protein kinase [Thermoleophilaceae bacterium]|jgi:serine/threonine protein kinase|nr:eukaryotic-like serine/threonine-protein kinase [Thermoleophilaceae bacterium]
MEGRLASGGTLCDGRYVLDRPLGSGGMASVWLARDEQLGRSVAVKVISDALALDSAFVERFRREARTAARLSHPNLVRIFDFASDDDRPFLVMEYVDGTTLAGVIARHGALDGPELASSLLSALQHIHAAGVVHRDVKPANILIGSDGRARLTDFGIAHPEDATHLTATGMVLGTLKYMAPEASQGEIATERSDLYSLGVVLSEAAPHDARLAPLLQSLTQRDPLERPRSAADALALIGDGGDEVRPATAPTRALPAARTAVLPAAAVKRALGRAGSFGRRKPLAIAAVALALLLVVIAVAGGGSGGVSGAMRSARSSAGSAHGVPAPAPSGAKLGAQLDALDRAVGSSRAP